MANWQTLTRHTNLCIDSQPVIIKSTDSDTLSSIDKAYKFMHWLTLTIQTTVTYWQTLTWHTNLCINSQQQFSQQTVTHWQGIQIYALTHSPQSTDNENERLFRLCEHSLRRPASVLPRLRKQTNKQKPTYIGRNLCCVGQQTQPDLTLTGICAVLVQIYCQSLYRPEYVLSRSKNS